MALLLKLRPVQITYRLKRAQEKKDCNNFAQPKLIGPPSSFVKDATSQSTLTRQAALSLPERVRDFNYMRQTLAMTYHRLRRIYRDNGVTFKKIITKRKFRANPTAESISKDCRVFANLGFRI